MHQENLRKLADYLLKGELGSDFDMHLFTSYLDEDEAVNCGTSGCAAGHGPYAGIEKFATETWVEYVGRVFGLEWCTNECAWCFSPNWERTDNSATGAAKRILWLLDKGLPEQHEAQRRGDVPLCYLQ